MNNKEKIIIMKTKITSAIAIVAIALTMVLNLNLSTKNNSLSDISLSNIEALAKNDDDGETRSCWQGEINDDGLLDWYCGNCDIERINLTKRHNCLI